MRGADGDRSAHERVDDAAPPWIWPLSAVGLAVGFFGVLILIMGALMSETGAPKGGVFIEVTEYHVEPWLFWLGGASTVAGTVLCLPWYRISFGRTAQAPAPAWLAPVEVATAAFVSVAALPVALAAASESQLQWQAYSVTGVVLLLVAIMGIGMAVSAPGRSGRGGGAGAGGTVTAGEAHDEDETR